MVVVGPEGSEVFLTLIADAVSLQPGSVVPERMSVCVSGLAVEVTRPGDQGLAQFPVLMQPLSAELALTLSQPSFEASEAAGSWRPPLVVLSLSATVDKLDLTPSDDQLQLLLRTAASFAEMTQESRVSRDRWALARLVYSRGRRIRVLQLAGGGKLPLISRARLLLQAMRALVRPVSQGLLPRLYCEVYARHLEARLRPEIPSEVSWTEVRRDFRGTAAD